MLLIYYKKRIYYLSKTNLYKAEEKDFIIYKSVLKL